MDLIKNVKLNVRKNEKFDPRFGKLVRIIRWQGRAIIILVALVIGLSLYKTVLYEPKADTEAKLVCRSELPLKSPEYSSFIYQGAQSVRYGDTVKSPTVVLMGQVHDYARVMDKWPDIRFILNGAAVPLNNYGNYLIEMNLKPGANTIETALRIGDETSERKQITLTYLPETTTAATVQPSLPVFGPMATGTQINQ